MKPFLRAYWGFDGRTWDDLLTDERYVRHVGEVADWVASEDTTCDVLDLGCGTGNYSLELGSRGHRVVGIDFAPRSLSRAEEKRAAAGMDNVRFLEADLTEPLPFPDGSFDAALAISSTQMLDAAPLFAEVARVLRPGGRFLVESPSPKPHRYYQNVDAPLAHRVFFAFKHVLIAFDRRVGLIKIRDVEQHRRLLADAGFQVVDDHSNERAISLLAGRA